MTFIWPPVETVRYVRHLDGVSDLFYGSCRSASNFSQQSLSRPASNLQRELVAPASLFGKITEGSEYQVDLEAPLSGQFAAEAVIVDRVLDGASGTFGIRPEIPNPDGLIPAGAPCTVNFAIN